MSRRRRHGGSSSGRPAQASQAHPASVDHFLDLVEETTELLEETSARRDRYVAQARELGASWHKIGLAAHITPQGANKRWAHRA